MKGDYITDNYHFDNFFVALNMKNKAAGDPENCGTGERLLDFSVDFKQTNEHGIEKLCGINRPVLLDNLISKLNV